MLVCALRGLSSEMQVCRDMYVHVHLCAEISSSAPLEGSQQMDLGESNNPLSCFLVRHLHDLTVPADHRYMFPGICIRRLYSPHALSPNMTLSR